MLAAQVQTHDLESIRLIVFLIATGAVIFWRIAIKLAIITAIVLTILGVLTLLNGLH
jgi:hypothetical protein